MKKSKILILILMLSLLLGVVFATAVSALVRSDVNSGGDLASTSWISAPSKTMVQCDGGETCTHENNSCYAYSFAVVGDTQNLNYIDAKNYVAAKAENADLTYAAYTSAHMRTLYNWILSNKDSKNIQYVMGLGDITQSFNTNQTYYDEEWQLAKEALSLLDGKLGYSLVRGNHDISSGMNGVFGVGNRYYNDLAQLAATTDAEGRPMAAFRDETKIEDSYRKIVTSNGDKYIIFTLEYYPTEDTVTWLNEALTANSDYTAIITLHAFLNKDATFVNDFETTTPSEDAVSDTWNQTATGGNVEPKVLWENALSKHANVKLILSGHVANEDIVVNQLKGENGNTVTCMLIDGQNIDSNVEPVGLVTMFYVKADGSIVNVEHISTVRAAANEDAYLKAVNQFEIKLDYGSAWTTTAYGNIPTAEYEANTFHVFLDDDEIADNTNFHFGSFNDWNETLTAIHGWNGIGGVSARAKKTYNILMSKAYTFSAGIPSNKSGSNPGKFNLDLGGQTITLSDDGVLVPFYNARTDGAPAFTVQNGSVIMSGTAKLAVLQTSLSDAGSSITLNLSDLEITYSGSASPVVGMYGGTAGSKADVALNVTDCIVNTTGASGAVTLFALNDAKNNNDVSLNIVGGSVIGTTSANLTMYTLNSGDDSAKFSPDENGNYTTVSLTENVAPAGVFRNEDSALLNFVTESTEAPYVFTTELAAVEETPYGNIPTDTYPAASYPFVLFQNGEVVAAYATWYDFCQNIWSFDTSEAKNSVLYLRESISIDKTSNQLRNAKNITIDLGGNNVNAAVTLFNFMADGNYDFTTNINVKNGTITAAKAWAPIIAYNSANTSDVNCCFNMVFDGVTMNASSNFQGRLLVEAWKDGTYGTTNTITLNNCTFDVTVGAVSKLFQLEESNGQNKVDVAININGGKLIANSYFTIGTFSDERTEGEGSPDTLTFGKDGDGNEFALQMPSTEAHPTTGISTTDGTLYPIETVDDTTTATYYFKSIETKYGTISTSNLSVVDYPFVLFKNGEQIHAAKSWYTLVQTDFVNKSALQTGATLLVRRDYDTTDAGKASQNLYYIKDLTIDLGGHTVTRGSYHLFQAMEKHTTARRIVITVKNGTLVSKGAPIISFNDHGDSTVVSGYDFIFEDVTIDLSAGKNLANCYTNGDEGMSNTITLNNCTVNIGSYAKALTIFSLSESSGNKQDVAVTFNGGKIVADSISNLTLASFSAEREEGVGSPDSLKFGAYNGNYVSFVTKSGSAAPTYDFVTVNGAAVSFADVSTSENAIYQLGEDIVTEYGTIPFAYADIEKYPVIIFKNGEYFGNNTVFSAGYSAALAETDDSVDTTAVVLLRKSLTEALSASLSYGEKIKGTLIVDLGGNTYETSAKALFQFNSKNSSNNPKIEIRNGRLNTVRLIAFANQTTAICQQYDILFKDVTLGFTSGTWNSMISTNKTASSDGYYALANVTFENCIFDLKSNQTFTSYQLFDLALDTNNHAVNVVFRGGEFILGDYTFTLATIKSGYSDNTNAPEGANDSDTVVFEKGENGYPVFRLPSGAAALTNVYNSTELTFVNTSDNGTEAVYTLMPAAAVNLNFVPKSSITLSNALIYNVYVPVNSALKSFTLDGVTYTDFTVLVDIVTINANNYYHFEIELPSAEAARDIMLLATVTVDGKDYDGSWTMSIPKYAAKLIEIGADVEKQLAKDVLAYIKEAYNYFDDYNDAAEITRVTALIESIMGDYTAVPVSTGDTVNAAGVTDVTLNLDAKPTIRFYVTDTALEFSANGKKLNTVTGSDTKGTYVELDVYAYALCETINYGDGGSYHISSFVNGALGTEYEMLVKAFVKYVESAAAYRNSVVNN